MNDAVGTPAARLLLLMLEPIVDTKPVSRRDTESVSVIIEVMHHKRSEGDSYLFPVFPMNVGKEWVLHVIAKDIFGQLDV